MRSVFILLYIGSQIVSAEVISQGTLEAKPKESKLQIHRITADSSKVWVWTSKNDAKHPNCELKILAKGKMHQHFAYQFSGRVLALADVPKEASEAWGWGFGGGFGCGISHFDSTKYDYKSKQDSTYYSSTLLTDSGFVVVMSKTYYAARISGLDECMQSHLVSNLPEVSDTLKLGFASRLRKNEYQVISNCKVLQDATIRK